MIEGRELKPIFSVEGPSGREVLTTCTTPHAAPAALSSVPAGQPWSLADTGSS